MMIIPLVVNYYYFVYFASMGNPFGNTRFCSCLSRKKLMF